MAVAIFKKQKKNKLPSVTFTTKARKNARPMLLVVDKNNKITSVTYQGKKIKYSKIK
jgi:hypothetical protein